MEVSARQPHPSEPGEPRLAAPISRRLPLARAGRAQDLPASSASPCSAPNPSLDCRVIISWSTAVPRITKLTTTSAGAQLASHSLGAQSLHHNPPHSRSHTPRQRAILPSHPTHTAYARDPSVTSATAGASAPCLRSLLYTHGAAGFPKGAIFVAVDGDARSREACGRINLPGILQRAALPAQMSHDLDAHCVTYGPNGTRAH